jgi:hypothetical protein
MSLQTLAQQIADVATQHVVEDLVDINFGPDEPAPRITFQEIGSRNAVTAEAIALLVNSGVLLKEPALERYIRETYGIPDKEPLPGQPPAPDADHRRQTDAAAPAARCAGPPGSGRAGQPPAWYRIGARRGGRRAEGDERPAGDRPRPTCTCSSRSAAGSVSPPTTSSATSPASTSSTSTCT